MESEDQARPSTAAEDSILRKASTYAASPALIHGVTAGKSVIELFITGVRFISGEFSKKVQAFSASPGLPCGLSSCDDNFSPQGCPWAY